MSTESSADPQSNPPSHRDRKNRERDKVKDQVPTPQFATTPVGSNPLGEGNWIRSAAALVIGDEILNGKTQDTNSNYFARFCFEHGIDLKRIEVIPDEEDDIIETARRLVSKYDFVITTGGIGPTHDDITYSSLGAAFSLPLTHHAETLRRMQEFSTGRYNFDKQNEEQKSARERMALFPTSPSSGEGKEEQDDENEVKVIYTNENMWVPVVRLKGRLHIFPGIPSLFQKMLRGLVPHLALPPIESRPKRMQVFTRIPESSIAPYLTALQSRVKEEGIRIGSYPLLHRGVYVSIIGPASNPGASSEEGGGEAKEGTNRIKEVAEEVARELQGNIIEKEGKESETET